MTHRLTTLLILVVAFAALAAPALKRGDDQVVGELRILGSADPVVILKTTTPEGVTVETTYWLVFTTAADEEDCRKIESGRQVRAIGRRGHGGQYRYVVVSSVERIVD